nr:immunoglobulin heavy chain junction region [Macaca mulatta]MOX62333.1 immunoglobulin heavy chain junction region [Macaca mulatta]
CARGTRVWGYFPLDVW